MFINKTSSSRNNACGERIRYYRKRLKLSQRALADQLQLTGLDVNKNAIQRIEAGLRFVTDIELYYFTAVLQVDYRDLIDTSVLSPRNTAES